MDKHEIFLIAGLVFVCLAWMGYEGGLRGLGFGFSLFYAGLLLGFLYRNCFLEKVRRQSKCE